MAGAAHLSDPAVIRALRQAVVRYRQQVATALAGAPTALARTVDHLRCELGPHWKRELGRRQDAHAEARRKWLEAEAEVRARGQRGQIERASSDDERREMLRQERRVREAEEKLAAIRTWLIRLESDGKDLLAQCQGHAESLDDLADRASRHLDRLATDIDAYLERPAS